MSDDFINAFADVNILQVEAVGAVVGRVIAKLHQGMTEAGLSEDQANTIINGAVKSLMQALASK